MPWCTPGGAWSKIDAVAALGWSLALLEQAKKRAEAIGSAAVMVIQAGRVVVDWGETAKKFHCHSMRKSLLSALIGIYVDDGVIDVTQTLGELDITEITPLTAGEKQACILDLLRVRSGVYLPAHAEASSAMASKPPRGTYAPGEHWHYNNWDFNTLGTIFVRLSGTSIHDAFQQRIAAPLAMEDFAITDVSSIGGPCSMHPAYPFRMTARDLARFGLLYLRNGRWYDTQVIPAAWIRESTTAHSEVPPTEAFSGPGTGYGYMWWTLKGQQAFPGVDFKGQSYLAAGHGGHYIFVLPYADLVIVHRVDTDRPGVHVTDAEMGSLLRLLLAAAWHMRLDTVSMPESEPDFDKVPLPPDVEVLPPSNTPTLPFMAFGGRWAGVWESGWLHVLVVEKIDTEFPRVIYAWRGPHASHAPQSGWERLHGWFRNGELWLHLANGAKATYRLVSSDSLLVTYAGPATTGQTTLRRWE